MTLRHIVIAALFAASTLSPAQSAKVIALSPDDAKEAKALYAQRDAVNRAIEDLQRRVEERYLSETKPGRGTIGIVSGSNITLSTSTLMSGCFITYNGSGESSTSGCATESAADKKLRLEREAAERAADAKLTHLERKDGWREGFSYSEDFKFVVPLQIAPPTPYRGCLGGIFSGTAGTSVPLTSLTTN